MLLGLIFIPHCEWRTRGQMHQTHSQEKAELLLFPFFPFSTLSPSLYETHCCNIFNLFTVIYGKMTNYINPISKFMNIYFIIYLIIILLIQLIIKFFFLNMYITFSFLSTEQYILYYLWINWKITDIYIRYVHIYFINIIDKGYPIHDSIYNDFYPCNITVTNTQAKGRWRFSDRQFSRIKPREFTLMMETGSKDIYIYIYTRITIASLCNIDSFKR